MLYFVYILKCADNYLYTGITGNLNKRITEHNSGEVPNTKNRLPIKLVYKEEFNNRLDAAKREKEIKGWRREKKEFLIKGFKNLY
jgi:putative endonuclease